jgi:hypothetical protein
MRKKSRKFDSELAMQKYWNGMDVSQKFYTEDNIPLIIRSGGFWNHESGPDFKNAAIKLGDRKLKGDIELHMRASDWFTHQHQHDGAYAKVILHVVCENDLSQDKRELLPPMLVLKQAEDELKELKGKCSEALYDLGIEKSREIFLKAGAHRFKEKSRRFVRQIIIEGTEQSFWRFVFEAAGYKQNSAAFKILFKRFLAYPDELRKSNFEDILWGESGLLPDLATAKVHPEMKIFVRERWNNWWRIRHQSNSPILWKSGGRPTNSPERRLAVLVNWMREFGDTPLKDLGKYAEKSSPEQLVEHIMSKLEVSDDLWDNFVNFNTKKTSPAKISGTCFVLEVIVNVIFPAIYAMKEFDIFNKPEFVTEQIEKSWQILPPTQENAITKRAGSLWFKDAAQKSEVLDSAAARQGLIHIYREYCEKCQSDCNSCKWL